MRQKQLEALKKKEADGAASGASGGNWNYAIFHYTNKSTLFYY